MNNYDEVIIWVSYKDWEVPKSRIWLAEIDTDRGLDFSRYLDLYLDWLLILWFASRSTSTDPHY